MTNDEIDLELATLMEPKPKLFPMDLPPQNQWWLFYMGDWIPKKHTSPEIFSMVIDELMMLGYREVRLYRNQRIEGNIICCHVLLNTIDIQCAPTKETAAALALIMVKKYETSKKEGTTGDPQGALPQKVQKPPTSGATSALLGQEVDG